MPIPYGFNPKGEQITFDKLSKSYTQENGDDDLNPHRLTITVKDESAGPYLVIKTSNWPVSSKKELTDLIDDFCDNNGILLE